MVRGVRTRQTRHTMTGSIELEYVPTADQVADVLMKGLQAIKHERFVKMMGLT